MPEQQWEYQVFAVNHAGICKPAEGPDQHLNQLADEGWEPNKGLGWEDNWGYVIFRRVRRTSKVHGPVVALPIR